MFILILLGAELLWLPGARATVSDTHLNARVQEDELIALAEYRLDDVGVTPLDDPALIVGNEAPDIGETLLERAPLAASVERHFIERQPRGWLLRHPSPGERALARPGIAKEYYFHYEVPNAA
ncbi:hypothetical protein [Halomonas sp. JS92-SW72]|uniref:hypothetical protein n=1 Tax=Halomonas sp. JS92-SW72 TaxID=2306583 RepID=UPI0013C31189|nr:hypothetical protein [Halomonas sp. JS92-SW72]